MKKTKLLSALTALTLTAVSAVSTVASAEDSIYDWFDFGETKTVGDYTVHIYPNNLYPGECEILSCNDKTLSEVVIPDYIDGIHVRALNDCLFEDFDNLTSIDFGQEYKHIGDDLFKDCDSLVEVTLPEWLKDIETGMFQNCSNLKKVEHTSKESGSVEARAFFNCKSLETVILTDDGIPIGEVLRVGLNAFYNCDSLESIALPLRTREGLISKDAFNDCDNLKSVTIGGTEIEFDNSSYPIRPGTVEPTESTTEATEPTEQRYLPGDANCDGFVNIADAYTAAMFSVKDEMNFDIELTEVQLTNADVFNTGDGVNASDAFMIQQFATGVIDTL